MLIVTLGDLLLDVIVRLDEPLAPGGQAANVSAWAAALGARARCVARRGDDPAGTWVAAELVARGVELLGPVSGTTGVVVSIVTPDGERAMASDRGTATLLAPHDLDAAWFACDCLHISGYALLASPVDAAAARAAELARSAGARISLDVSAWTRIRRHGAARFAEQVEALAPDVVFGTEAEWDELGVGVGETRVIKRGAAGFDVAHREAAPERCQAQVTSVVDTTGAGDALAAGFLVGGTALALEAAARCVAKVGAMP